MGLFLTLRPGGAGDASAWVRRWAHLVKPGGSVLDLACGHGRHMRFFAERGHSVTGVDRSPEAIAAVACYGEAILADLENGPWPLLNPDHSGDAANAGSPTTRARLFDAVIVTHYLWRPLLPRIAQSLAPGGALIYETFAAGNETVGKPSRPDFLLQPGELLSAFAALHAVAFEDGFVDAPPRFVQRLAAIRPVPPQAAAGSAALPPRYRLEA